MTILASESRWRKANSQVLGLPVQSNDIHVVQVPREEILTEPQRFNKVAPLLQQISTIMTSSGTDVFRHRMNVLKKITSAWAENTNVDVHEVIPPTKSDNTVNRELHKTLNHEEPLGPGISVPHTAVPEPHDLSLELESSQSTDYPNFEDVADFMEDLEDEFGDTRTREEPTKNNMEILRSLQLPNIKKRGRPKMKRWLSRFNTNRELQPKRCRPQPTAQVTATSAGDESFTTCQECQERSPPSPCDDSVIQWVQCDAWIHVTCLGFEDFDLDGTFNCDNCC
jgi:hypothetical protein